VRYGYAGTMRTAPGRRDDVVAILLRDVDGLKAAGATCTWSACPRPTRT
jgi:hypothetical protein